MYVHKGNQRIGLNNILPTGWQTPGDQIIISFCICQIESTEKNALANSNKLVTQGDDVWYFTKGKIEYPHPIKLRGHAGEEINADLKMRTIPENYYLITFSKFDDLAIDKQKALIRAESNTILASIVSGINCSNNRIASNVIGFVKNGGTNYTITPTTEVEYTVQEFSGVFLSNEHLEGISNIRFNVNQLPENERNKIILASNWLLKSLRYKNVDSLLAKWIALETLCIEEGTNITPIIDVLSSAYEVTNDQIRNRFGIGKCNGLRGDIVHNGKSPKLKQELLNFLDFILIDCLNEKIGNECKKLSERYIEYIEFDPIAYLDELNDEN